MAVENLGTTGGIVQTAQARLFKMHNKPCRARQHGDLAAKWRRVHRSATE